MSEPEDRRRALEEAWRRRDAALALAQFTMSREAVMAFGRAGLALRAAEREAASSPGECQGSRGPDSPRMAPEPVGAIRGLSCRLGI